MEGTSGNARFYVMALEDINSGTRYCWYDAAWEDGGQLNEIYNVTLTDNDFAVAGAEPTGRINTKRMITSWNAEEYGAQNNSEIYDDMWGAIQEKVAEGWFVPSKSEWSTFGGAFGITYSNYSNTFGLSGSYWSSSQNTITNALTATPGGISHNQVYSNYFVRLATTF